MEDDIKVLFQKYVNNECSETEIIKLLEFFGIEENEELLKGFIHEEMESEEDGIVDMDEVDKRLKIIYSNINVRVIPMRLLVAAAAAILILLSAGLFYLLPKHETKQFATAAPVIKPGKNQAILRLADGREISLNDATNGTVATQSGVTITKAANGQLIYQDTNGGDAVQYNSIEAPAGGQWEVVLPDKSHVWLNSKTTLKYPTRFTGSERKVELNGEAYFEIAADQRMPFKVVSKKHTVEVLGTHFNVMNYEDESSEKTTLFEGAVRINTKILRPGEQASVNSNGIQINEHPDLEEVIAWKNGYFKFNGRLEDIMNKISRWYDVDVVYLNKPNYTFEGEISRNKDLNEILKIMEYTGKVHFVIKERKIEVSN